MANLESPEGEDLLECVSVFGAPGEKTFWSIASHIMESPIMEKRDEQLIERLEVQPSRTRNNPKRKAPLYHKGVHLKQSNNKFVARLCLTGGKGKLELGEYQSHEEAARAYDVGAFYYQRLECNCTNKSFQDKLPPVPDNISEEQKKKWVSGRAREFALLFDAERDASAPGRELGSACSSLFTFQLEEQPGTPASYGTQGGSCCYPTDARTPLTSASDGGNFFSGWNDHDIEFSVCDLDVTSVDRRKRKGAAHVANDTTRWIPTPSLVSRRGVTNLEEQQEWNTDQNLSADQDHSHQAVPQLKMTDSICYAHCELRKQGWEWTLKPRPTSAKMGVLFSLPQGQDAPALLMTDIVMSSFYELREQGWEVYLEARKRDIIDGVTVDLT